MEISYLSRENCELFSCNADHCRNHWTTRSSIDYPPVKQQFAIIYCAKCKVGFTNPYPSEETIGLLYEDRASTFNFDPITDSFIDKLKDYFGKQMLSSLLEKNECKDIKRVLDYGTGNGRYAALSMQVFPDAIIDGVDYQDEPPSLFTKLSSPRLAYINANNFSRTDTRYDLIILRHVLEHNHHPVQFMGSLRDRLSDNGKIFIEVPNLESWYNKKAVVYLNSYSVPYHLFHYTIDSLKLLLDTCGFESEISTSEMPLMGGVVAAILKMDRNLFTQSIGAILQPLQIFFSWRYGAPCLSALCKKKSEV